MTIAEYVESLEDDADLEADATGEQEANPEALLAGIIPVFVAALLEPLQESDIDCVGQAAFYFLSGHPEHQEAATAWFQGDPRNLRAYGKFARANRYYKELVELLLTYEEPEPD